MKYTSKKGTVINIPDGLTAQQIAKIKADADSGYGTRAQQTAIKLRKKVGRTTPGATTPADDGGVFNNKGRIDDPDNFLSKIPNFEAFRAGVEDAAQHTADFATRDFERDKAREMEAAKQELANRGIPYNPAEAQNPNSTDLYGRTIGGITQRYQDATLDARNSAYSSALNSALSAYGTNVNAFIQGALGADQNTLTKYGIDKDFLAKLKSIQAEKDIARIKSASSKKSSGDAGGFEILG